MEKKKVMQGINVRYLTNKHDDYDKLVIKQNGKNSEIKFPPHTARFVRAAGSEGDTVEVETREDHHPGKMRLVSIRNIAGGKAFVVDSVKPPHPPESGRLVSFTVTAPEFTRGGKDNAITGILFEGAFIHFHPEEYDEPEETWTAAPVLYVKAKKRTESAGFMNASGHAVYHLHEVEIGDLETT